MQQHHVLLERFREDRGGYPTMAEGRAVLAPYVTAGGTLPPANDLWGNPYHYNSPSEYVEYDLAAFGANGAVGGEDENADITSWAEGSLVARWAEYTPTGAKDIRFAQTLPDA